MEAEEKRRAVERSRSALLPFTLATCPWYRPNWHHEVLAQTIQRVVDGTDRFVIVELPPQHGKSELISRRAPAWVLGRNPDERIIAASYSADLATAMSRDVRRIMDSDEYREMFPATRLPSDRDPNFSLTASYFEIPGHRGYYLSAGVGGGITGRTATLGLIDDPYKNRQDADSPTVREAIWDWFTSTFYTRLAADARVILCMTRWHVDDLAGRLIRQQPGKWKVVRLLAVLDEGAPDDDPRDEGDALWPAFKDLDALADIRATIGSRDWEALYQQRPTAPGGSIIHRDHLRFYRTDPQAIADECSELVQTWDCAFKDADDSDYVVGQVWGKRGSQVYLLDQVRDRMTLPGTIAAVLALSAKWPTANRKLVEAKANGPAVIQSLRERLPGLIGWPEKGHRLAQAGKGERMQAVSPFWEAGNVLLPEGAPWLHDCVEEIVNYPAWRHDDCADAMTMGVIHLLLDSRSFQVRVYT